MQRLHTHGGRRLCFLTSPCVVLERVSLLHACSSATCPRRGQGAGAETCGQRPGSLSPRALWRTVGSRPRCACSRDASKLGKAGGRGTSPALETRQALGMSNRFALPLHSKRTPTACIQQDQTQQDHRTPLEHHAVHIWCEHEAASLVPCSGVTMPDRFGGACSRWDGRPAPQPLEYFRAGPLQPACAALKLGFVAIEWGYTHLPDRTSPPALRCPCLSRSPPSPAAAAPAADCDCAAVRLLQTDVPVCDEDGVTYANACLAQCQGVSASPCASQQQQRAPQAGMAALHPDAAAQGEQLMAPLLFNPGTLDSEVPITLADIEAFKAEGFRLAARVKLIPGQVSTPGLAPASDT